MNALELRVEIRTVNQLPDDQLEALVDTVCAGHPGLRYIRSELGLRAPLILEHAARHRIKQRRAEREFRRCPS